jgi:hypothetical protein
VPNVDVIFLLLLNWYTLGQFSLSKDVCYLFCDTEHFIYVFTSLRFEESRLRFLTFLSRKANSVMSLRG